MPGRREPAHHAVEHVARGGDEAHGDLAVGRRLVVRDRVVEDHPVGRPGRRPVELVANDRIEVAAARRRKPQDLAQHAAPVEPHLERLRQQLARQLGGVELVETALGEERNAAAVGPVAFELVPALDEDQPLAPASAGLLRLEESGDLVDEAPRGSGY